MRSRCRGRLKRADVLYSATTSRFIDNVMTAFLGMNRIDERKRLEDSLLRLSRMIHYAEGAERIVSLQEEGSFIEDYLELQRLRYPERLAYRIDLGNGADRIFTERFILFSGVESVLEGLLERSAFGGTLVLERRGSESAPVVITMRSETPDGRLSASTLRLRGRRGRDRFSKGAGPSCRRSR